jgi:hypothetical protein
MAAATETSNPSLIVLPYHYVTIYFMEAGRASGLGGTADLVAKGFTPWAHELLFGPQEIRYTVIFRRANEYLTMLSEDPFLSAVGATFWSALPIVADVGGCIALWRVLRSRFRRPPSD